MKKQVKKLVAKKNSNNVKKAAINAELDQMQAQQPSTEQTLGMMLELSERLNALQAKIDAMTTPTPTPTAEKAKVKKQKSAPTPTPAAEDIDRDTAVEMLVGLVKEKTIRITDIAKFVGIASSSVTCWLNGVSLPARKHMDKVIALLHQYAS